MKKRYEVKGMMEWHPVFVAGRSRIKVSFEGGHLCGGGATPAVFETADPVVQKVIESSEAFRSGRIRLGRSPAMQASHCVVPMPPASSPSAITGLVRAEYETFGDAADALHYEKGVLLSKLADEASCIAEGRRLGIDVVITGKKD